MKSINNTFEQRLEFRDLIAFVRRHLPVLVVVLLAGALTFWREMIAVKFVSNEWSLAAFYAALFDWSSIQGAFLFGVYAFVLARSEPFIRAVAKTQAFDRARSYVRGSVYLSLALTVLSVPMLISPWNFDLSARFNGVGYVLFCAYALFATYLLMRFIKVLRIFRLLEMSRDPE